jgi:hypothetical protein
MENVEVEELENLKKDYKTSLTEIVNEIKNLIKSKSQKFTLSYLEYQLIEIERLSVSISHASTIKECQKYSGSIKQLLSRYIP